MPRYAGRRSGADDAGLLKVRLRFEAIGFTIDSALVQHRAEHEDGQSLPLPTE